MFRAIFLSALSMSANIYASTSTRYPFSQKINICAFVHISVEHLLTCITYGQVPMAMGYYVSPGHNTSLKEKPERCIQLHS